MIENADTSDEARLYQLREVADHLSDSDSYQMSPVTLRWLLGMVFSLQQAKVSPIARTDDEIVSDILDGRREYDPLRDF